jgi:predicted deacylase
MLVLASAMTSAAPVFDRPDRWFDDHVYHHHADLTTELTELRSLHPAYVDLTSIGNSVQGRELWNVRITDPAYPAEGKTRIYIDGEHHGNEYLGGELCILLLHHLLEDQTDPLVEQVLRECIVYVTPMLNPDGNARDRRYNVNGVDLNRHYPFHFSPGGSHGDAPGVEPEVAGNIAFMERTDLDLYITMHTGIVRLVHPWGWTHDPSPDHAMFTSLTEISEGHGIAYGQASEVLYIVEGSSKDYSYGVLGVPGFTYEVDDEQTRQITRREDIASRLSDELALLMDMLVLAKEMNARLEVNGTRVSTSGSEVEVSVDLGNPTRSPANNTTVRVEVRSDGALVASHSSSLDVPAGEMNTTRVRFTVDGAGEYQLRTIVEWPELLVENATMKRRSLPLKTVTVEGSFMASSGGWAIGLIILLVALGAAFLWWAWGRGWRPGWAARRLLDRLPGRSAGEGV